MSTKYRIATIPGDGIGKEVIPAGQRAVEAGREAPWVHRGMGSL